MILITVGSSHFPFARMNALVGRLSAKNNKREEIIFQYGALAPQYYHPPITLYPFISQETLLLYMKRARIIISHGGPATIYQSLSFGKTPFVFPRQQTFGEHLTDHQVAFSSFMATRGLIRIITDETPIAVLQKGSPKAPPLRHRNTKLINFLESLCTV